MTINSFWIEGELQPVNHLTIRSFQSHGHEFVIYSYVELPNAGCEVRDANEFLPRESIYHYRHLPDSFKLGGFAELLKATLLHQIGGWHVDMDVTCLKPFWADGKYAFRPHKLGAVGNIIKAPAGTLLTNYYLKWANSINEHNQDFERSIAGLYAAIVFCGLENYIVPASTFGKDEDKYYLPFLQNGGAVPNGEAYAIHWCGAMGHVRNYEPRSYFETLLKQYSIV